MQIFNIVSYVVNHQFCECLCVASAPLRPVSSQLSSKSTAASNVKKSAPQDQPANLHPVTTVEKATGRYKNNQVRKRVYLFLFVDRRKSNCVKEVERLKKNRDDRRYIFNSIYMHIK